MCRCSIEQCTNTVTVRYVSCSHGFCSEHEQVGVAECSGCSSPATSQDAPYDDDDAQASSSGANLKDENGPDFVCHAPCSEKEEGNDVETFLEE